MKKYALNFCWFFSGVCYVLGYYVLSALGCAWIASLGVTSSFPQILLTILSFLGIVIFFVITHFFGKRAPAIRTIFPIGVFLTADTVLVVILAKDLLSSKRLLELAGGEEQLWLAQSYAKCGFVLILGLVLLVVAWLISVLFRQFKKFQAMAAAYEAQNAAARAALDIPEAPTIPDSPTTPETPTTSDTTKDDTPTPPSP